MKEDKDVSLLGQNTLFNELTERLEKELCVEFPELKNFIKGESFQTSVEIQGTFQAHLTPLAATVFEKDFVKVVHQYDKYLNFHKEK